MSATSGFSTPKKRKVSSTFEQQGIRLNRFQQVLLNKETVEQQLSNMRPVVQPQPVSPLDIATVYGPTLRVAQEKTLEVQQRRTAWDRFILSRCQAQSKRTC